MSFNTEEFKSHFPLFSHPENRELVYLDNAATTQRPLAVINAISHFYSTSNANTHRSSHRLARRATEMVERTRSKAQRFLAAATAAEIVFIRGATEGLNFLAASLAQQLQAGDEILLSRAEHHANIVPWQMAAKAYQLKLCFLPQEGDIPDTDLANAYVNNDISNYLTKRTKIIALTGGSNALGFKPKLNAIISAVKAFNPNIISVIDAAQLAAHEPIDVRQLGCDFLVCSAHKFYGPTGIGLLYGQAHKLQFLPPWQGGGEMVSQVSLHESTYTASPHRFEAGTSSLAAIAGLEASLDFLALVDRQSMAQYEQTLISYLHQQLTTVEDLRLLSNANSNLGIATWAPQIKKNKQLRWHPTDMVHWLDEQDIAVRAGHLCAQPLINDLIQNKQFSIRASIAGYTTHTDIDKLVAALHAMPRNHLSKQHKQEQYQNQENLNIAMTEPDTEDTGLLKEDDVTSTWSPEFLSQFSLQKFKEARPWQQKYKLLLQWGNLLPDSSFIRHEQYSVKGCESASWIKHYHYEGHHRFLIDSESRLIKGLAVLLLLFINHRTTAELAELNISEVFENIGLQKHLSPSRNNGFKAIADKALSLAQHGSATTL